MTEVRVRLRPCSVPNYVLADASSRPREEGITEAPKWHISDLDAETLAELCDDFRRTVFAKAGKRDPEVADG